MLKENSLPSALGASALGYVAVRREGMDAHEGSEPHPAVGSGGSIPDSPTAQRADRGVKALSRPYIGGQALLEGVMMRSPKSFSIVCRRRSGELWVRERAMVDERKGLRAWPLVRGVATLVESLRLGSEALRYSAALYEQDMEAVDSKEGPSNNGVQKPGILSTLAAYSLPIVALASLPDGEDLKSAAQGSEKSKLGQGLMVLFALGVFIAAPQVAASLANRVFHLNYGLRSVGFQLLTGFMKLSIVIGYLMLIRRVPEIRRVFQYHGAEHKSISTYEAGEPLLVAHARSKSTLHPRCGTTFLVMVAIVSVVVFTAIGPFLPRIGVLNGWSENLALFVMKIPFIPLIAAITFEIQRLFARYCTQGPLRALLWPGFLVQKITTIEPDDDQLEVALASLRATLWRERDSQGASAALTEVTFPSYDSLVAHHA